MKKSDCFHSMSLKRRLCFYLTVIAVVTCCCNAFAEENVKPETIKFRDIDWGITPDEFDQQLLEIGLDYTKKKSSSVVSKWYLFDGMPYSMEYLALSDYEIKVEMYKYQSAKNKQYSTYPIINVAGYNVSDIVAEFMPSYSLESGIIGEPYRLSRATYEIYSTSIPKEMSVEEAYDDLFKKLSNLYGGPAGSDKGSHYLRRTWWYAKDGTGVSLRMIDTVYYPYIEIMYGVADETDFINTIYAFKQKEKQNVIDSISDDTSGL